MKVATHALAKDQGLPDAYAQLAWSLYGNFTWTCIAAFLRSLAIYKVIRRGGAPDWAKLNQSPTAYERAIDKAALALADLNWRRLKRQSGEILSYGDYMIFARRLNLFQQQAVVCILAFLESYIENRVREPWCRPRFADGFFAPLSVLKSSSEITIGASRAKLHD